MSVWFDFDEVDAFTVGAVGEPGSRVFFLTARAGGRRVSVRCEKQQVKAIATYLRHVLSDLPPPEVPPPPTAPAGDEVAVPDDHEFVLGPVGLGYDRGNDRLLVQLEEMLDSDLASDDDEDELPGVAREPLDRGHIRFYVTRGQADAFCARADRLVAAGRPTCMWCGHPMDPDGHTCPRMN